MGTNQLQTTAVSQMIQVICIGNNLKSGDILFYLPTSQKLISFLVYKLNPLVPSRPMFNLKYNGNIGLNTYSPCSKKHRPTIYEIGKTVSYWLSETGDFVEGFILVASSHGSR